MSSSAASATVEILGLQDKVACVTGAGGGFGRQYSVSAVKLGACVLVVDISKSAAIETKRLCVEAIPGARVEVFVADVSREEDNIKMIGACVKYFGRIDIFWANAGIIGAAPSAENTLKRGSGFIHIDAQGWRDTFAVNLDGVFFGYKAAATQMMKQQAGGSIIGTASVAGILAGGGTMAYSVTKAGVIHLTRTASHYLSGTNIRVNCICPGVVATKLTTDVIGKTAMNQLEKDFTDGRVWSAFRNPMMRYGSVVEVSNVALFLSSNLSTFVNGQAIAVDGGQTAMYNLPALAGKPPSWFSKL